MLASAAFSGSRAPRLQSAFNRLAGSLDPAIRGAAALHL
jgi:hypothetical protein